MISVCLQGKLFNITVIQIYAPTTDAKEAEGDLLQEDLENLLELTPKKKKDVLFILGDLTPGKFGLGEQNEAGQRLI